MSKPILIVMAGKTFPEISKSQGDFGDWIAAGLGNELPYTIVSATEVTEFPRPAELSGVVISGSHAMVTDREDWSERLGGWLKSCVAEELPVLGICYGHQLLAHACGGVVNVNPAGLEIGTKEITLAEGANKDLLLGELPATFPAQLIHYQSVRSLPEGAQLLAHSDIEPHQAYRIGNYAWGVQFHPEFSATAMRGYITQLQAKLDDHERLLAKVEATQEATSLLQRFAAISKAKFAGA
ncbi:MAG: glutamine amidotransferase [Cellvibrio sp.]|uniref:glutamine amidotransferase n=1 Tax=Cellvibrio sp. TaxID=1965322 RepID=UPI0031A49F1E